MMSLGRRCTGDSNDMHLECERSSSSFRRISKVIGSLNWRAPLHMQRCPFESKRRQRPVTVASSYEESMLLSLRVQNQMAF